MTRVCLSILGMTCGGCSTSVSKALQAVAGVQSASVDLPSASATIDFDEAVCSVEDLLEAVEEAGFDVVAL